MRRMLRWTRRGLAGLLVLVVGGLIVGAAYQTSAEYRDRRRYAPPGRLIDVGGYRLHLYCTGSGGPTVALDAGLGGFSLDWSLVQPQVAAATRVCSYDRAGNGWSEPGPAPRDAVQVAKEWHTLMARSGERGPYVLVGHSLGGLHARLYASTYPQEVAGLVLVDPTPTATPAEQLQHMSAEERRQFEAWVAQQPAPPSQARQAVLNWLTRLAARVGLVRLIGAQAIERDTLLPYLPPEHKPAYRALLLRSARIDTVLAEMAAGETSAEQVRAATRPLDGRPVRVLVSNVPGNFARQAQPDAVSSTDLMLLHVLHRISRDLAHQFSSDGMLLVAEQSGHYIQIDQPDVVVQTIRGVVEAVRGKRAGSSK